MIARLKGVLKDKRIGAVVVMAGGVGYEVHIPLSTFYDLPDEDSEVGLHVKTIVREDALELFGFLTRAEREVFIILNSISKVGPRMALNILSGIGPAELVRAIGTKDAGRLATVPGIGPKTAERLIIELKDKLPQLTALVGVAPETEQPSAAADFNDVGRDVVSALMNLGYSRPEAEKAVAKAVAESSGQDLDLSDLLRQSLKRLRKA
jgi:Holliday junction DNA helicase RuvA